MGDTASHVDMTEKDRPRAAEAPHGDVHRYDNILAGEEQAVTQEHKYIALSPQEEHKGNDTDDSKQWNSKHNTQHAAARAAYSTHARKVRGLWERHWHDRPRYWLRDGVHTSD